MSKSDKVMGVVKIIAKVFAKNFVKIFVKFFVKIIAKILSKFLSKLSSKFSSKLWKNISLKVIPSILAQVGEAAKIFRLKFTSVRGLDFSISWLRSILRIQFGKKIISDLLTLVLVPQFSFFFRSDNYFHFLLFTVKFNDY